MKEKDEPLQKNNETRELWLDIGDTTEQKKDDDTNKTDANTEEEEEEGDGE
jgi:hypothetical protein